MVSIAVLKFLGGENEGPSLLSCDTCLFFHQINQHYFPENYDFNC